jgi:hypothetical protein
MALIHYYKFNNNLYDSIGTFDLLTDFGTPTYTTGKLGGSTGAVTSTTGSMYIFGCTGTGGAASGFLAADASEAASGVSAWSMTGWVYCSGTSTQIINLLSSTSGQSSAFLQYDQKFGGLTFRASGVSCSTNTWVFFTVRVTGGTCYLSVNGGSESSSAWNTGSGTGGKTQFNGIRIGSPSLYIALYARVDDVRIFNHSLSSGEIAGIYNAGSPAEATAATATWDQPIHHYKFTNNLNDSTGSVSAAFIPALGTGSYVSGLFTNSPNAVSVTQSSGVIATQPSQNWAGSTGWTVSYWLSFSSVSMAGGYVTYIFHDAFSQYFAHKFNSAGSYYEFYNGSSTIQISDSYFSGHKIIKYDAIAYRVTFYTSASGGPRIIAQMNAGTFLNTFQAQCPVAGTGDTFTLDDLRIYNKPLIGGVDYDPIYNSGSGTEYSVVSSGGSASGLLATITMSGPAGSATGGGVGSASGALSTVTMSGPAGSASSGSPGSASGLLATITVSSFSGIGGVGVTGSGSLSTITVSSFTGIAFREFIGTGSLSTVSVIPIEAVASISTSIQLSYVACDAEIGWKQSLPITGFVSAVQGEDAISARITPVVSGIDANIVFFEQRTLTASSSYTYDLRSLTDFLGQSFSLSRAYAISVVMTSGSATISPGASNPLKWFFNSNTANVTITSGNSFMFAQKGSAIVSNSAKTILVTNPSALSACVYKIAILGGR